MSTQNFSYENITNELLKIFDNCNLKIKKAIKEELKITTRNTKVSFDIALLYSLLYTEKYITKEEVVNDINNYEETDKYKNTTLYEKEQYIPLSFYTDLFKNIYEVHIKLFNNNDKKKVVAVDGTYNNTNIYNVKQFLETSLNMGFYNITDDIPFDLSFCSLKNKNREGKQLIEFIDKNKKYFKNIILVADRGYCSYDLINLFNKYKIKYVIRFRNNCKNFNKIKKKDYRMITKVIKYTEQIDNVYIDNYLIDNKKFKNVSFEYTDEYKILTNLDDSYTDDDILELYYKRWNVEIFFKIIKNNYKFEDLRITNNNGNDILYKKHNIKILIVYLINSIIYKAHSLINNVKEEGTIIKRTFKNKKIKNNNMNNKKKTLKCKNKKEENVINVSLKDNPNILINMKNKNNKNELTNENNKNNKKQIIEKNDNEQLIKNNEKKCNIKVNKSLSIKGTFKLLYYIIKSKLTTEKLKKHCNMYINYIKSDINLKKKRICKTPFKKWYVKGYTNKSDTYNIILYLLGFIKEVNSNLKMCSKKYKINNIEYIT